MVLCQVVLVIPKTNDKWIDIGGQKWPFLSIKNYVRYKKYIGTYTFVCYNINQLKVGDKVVNK